VGTAINASNLESFPAGTVGGLFDFGGTKPLRIAQIAIKFGGQSTWTFAIVDKDGIEFTVLSGTTEAGLLNTTLRPILLQGQKLKLVTVGASTAMRARISASRTVE
jgi:hypothetical protein